ncbi:CerR family C-terminal domain-containing protein, partial [Massilia glaciei]
QGFAKTSTREIALAAGTNVAAISYYFNDKAGLYRAAFVKPAPNAQDEIAEFTAVGASLRESLRMFYAQLLAPLKQGDLARLCMRLWFREMLEPTGLWHEEIDNGIRPAHAGLVLVLGRHLGVKEPGDDVARLAFSVVGLALQLMVARDVIDKIGPQLLATEDAIDTWMARLVDYAEAIVEAEKKRLAAPPTSKTSKTSKPVKRKTSP